VEATDGADDLVVVLTWTGVPGATSYNVIRGEEVIATGVTETTYDDRATDAPPGSSGMGLRATEGTRIDAVRVSWTEPDPAPGLIYEYRVEAVDDCGAGPRSAADSGHRLSPPPTRYEVRIDDGDWLGVGADRELIDDGAAAGTFDSAGTAVASDGTSVRGVSLRLADVEVSDGGPSDYRVRAINESGPGPETRSVSGYRAAPELSYQWETSDATDGEYGAVAEATDINYVDGSVRVDGTPRWYRCEVTPEPGASRHSAPDAGFRAVVTIRHFDETPGAFFGSSLAISGETLAIGVLSDGDEGEALTGRVHLYTVSDDDLWEEETTLDIDDWDGAMALDGDRLVVGVPGWERVRVYERGSEGWASADGPQRPADNPGQFGSSVALEGDRLIVGARDTSGVNEYGEPISVTGTAYAFQRELTRWQLEHRLVDDGDLYSPMGNPDGLRNVNNAGYSTAVTGDWAIVGAPGIVYSSGTVVVVRQRDDGGWNEPSQVDAITGGVGLAITAAGGRLLVADPLFDTTGSVFIYEVSGESWDGLATLRPPEGSDERRFGIRLALEGDVALVAAERRLGDPGPERAYLYRYDGELWDLEVIEAVDQTPQGGVSVLDPAVDVALSDNWAVVGYPHRDEEPEVVRVYWIGSSD
jgi:hypothetical protein